MMNLLRDLSAAQIALQIQGADIDQFVVVRYRGSEGLCQLYRFEIDLACDDATVNFEGFVGKACVLSINTVGGTRWFHGIVSRLEHVNESVGQTYYRAEIVPAMWTLTHRYGSRIFQNQTVPEIVEAVLAGAGIAGERVRIGPLRGKHLPREYCVQYRETEFNFICRLMEEEGIWWYFEQLEDRHVLVLADSATAYRAIEGDAKLVYRPASGLNTEEEHVFRFRRELSMRPGNVVLRDYSFENPTLDLESRYDPGRDEGLEFSDYPGEYGQQGAGNELARLRAEEFETTRRRAVGQSNCARLGPGRTFTLEEHPAHALNDAYLVTTVMHQGKQAPTRAAAYANGNGAFLDARVHQSLVAARTNASSDVRELAEAMLQIASRIQRADATAHDVTADWIFHGGQVTRDLTAVAGALGAGLHALMGAPSLLEDSGGSNAIDDDAPVYECRFECIPAAVVYRPSRVTPWPVMRGSQTARVVGPKDEDIHTDKYGRVKVQFNWDRYGEFDDKSSCWIRVSQGAAGGQYGMMFLPRIGQEVIVDFLEGDPDQPIITGRVFNADQMPPYALPDEKTRSTIKTNSTKGGSGTNEIRFEDLKDHEQILVYAQKDLHVRANNDRVESIERDDHRTVTGNRYELVKQSEQREIKLDAISKVGGRVLTEVTGDVGEEFKANHSEQVGTAYYLKAGQKVVIEAGQELTLKVGGNFIKIDSGGVTILGTKVKINSGGSPGTGTAVGMASPKQPLVADKAAPGADVRYHGGEKLVAAEVPPDLKGHEFKTSWIEVQLTDEAGLPVEGEVVEIVGPNGEKLSGITGADGVAHILVPEQGNCEISFPNLDGAAWEQKD